MSTTRARWHNAFVAALCLLPVASVGDTQRWQWDDGRQVRVATYPTLRPFPDAPGSRPALPTIAHGHFSAGLKLQTIRSGFPDQLHLLARADDQMLLDRVEQGLDRISLEEHAILGHRWAVRTLPPSIADALAQTSVRSSAVILPLAMLVLVGLWLRRRLARRGRHRSLSQASAVGMLSHEVRNSAHLVISALDLLRQLQLPASAQDLVNAANRATLELRGRLNRALDFSRLAAGTFQPKPRPCDAADIARQALDALSPEAQRKGLTLHLDVSPQPLPGLELDPDCLRQLLDNLLGNAIKFTDAGGIELRVQMLVDADAAHLLVDVIDSGIGIAPAQMAVLFQPFQPGDEGQARGGSGLGLSICQELARSMGGALDVHSVQGRGSRFSLRLPATITPLPDAQIATAAPSIAAPLLAGLDVLLVEDHTLSRRVLAAQLRKQGATVHEVSSAGAALLRQATAQHAVIVLDIELGHSNGYALAPQLRQASAAKGGTTQILALSAHTGAAHQQRCLQAGFDGVLSKPLQMDALLQALGLGDATAGPAAHDGDTLARALLEDLRREHTAAENAAHARDGVALAHHAHRLHGALQMQGMDELAAMAAALAQHGRERTPNWGDALHLVDQLRVVHSPGIAGAVQPP